MNDKLSKTTEQTIKNFFDAYAQIQIVKAIEQISVKEICQKAGYNRSTFYKYFLDIYDLRQQLEDMLVSKVHNPLLHTYYDNFESDPESARLIQGFEMYYVPNRIYFLALWGDYGDPEYVTKSISAIKGNLLPVLNSLDIPKDDIYVEYLAEFYAAGHIKSLLLWLNSMGGENEMSAAEIVKFLQTIRFKGIFSVGKYRGEELQKELSGKSAD